MSMEIWLKYWGSFEAPKFLGKHLGKYDNFLGTPLPTPHHCLLNFSFKWLPVTHKMTNANMQWYFLTTFDNFWQLLTTFGQIFWQQFVNFLLTFWQLFDNFLTAFWQLFDNFDNFRNFLTTFWQFIFLTFWHNVTL
jgi:hypothetical protein